MKKNYLLLLPTILLCACEPKSGTTHEEPKKPIGIVDVFKEDINGIKLDEVCDIDTYVTDGVTFKSLDESVVKVTDNKLEGVSAGFTTVEAYIENKKMDDCTVVVNNGVYKDLDGEEPLIKYNGRYYKDSEGLFLNNSLCGFETNFYGTCLSVSLISAGDNITPQLCVLIDGDEETMSGDNLVSLSKTKSSQTLFLAENLEEGFHSIKVYKTTEALISSLKINKISTDGFFSSKPAEKDLKMEIYGDSISVGHLNMRTTIDEPPEGQRDYLENGMNSYGYVAAKELGADLRLHARTGIGFYSAWGASYVMNNAYNDTFCSSKDLISNSAGPKYDLTSWIPNIVIINLGTNDYWFANNETNIKNSLKSLTDKLLAAYGDDTAIIYVHGIMVNGMNYQEDIAQEYFDAGKKVYSCKPLATPNSKHPRAETHITIGKTLASFIKSNVL